MTKYDLTGRRILLVEDEFLIALEIADEIARAGAQVSGPYTSLEDARAAADEESIDIAILDIDLRGEEVFPAAHRLRARNIPFFFYTGQPERETLRTEFADVEVLVKPSAPTKLLDAVCRLLGSAA